MVESEDLFPVNSAFMKFKLDQGLQASNPIKTAGWQEDHDYLGMQRHPDVPRLLTDCCSFISRQAKLTLFAGVVDIASAGYGPEETDERLIDLASSRLQMEAQDRRGIYLNGSPEEWKRPPVPSQPHKLGIEARVIADYPGHEEETRWDRMARHMWKMAGRSSTKLVLLDDCIYFAHTRSCGMLQIADIVVGAIRSYVRSQPRERFEILLPRFRRSKEGRLFGYGLVFDPRTGTLAERFRENYTEPV